MTRFGVLSDVHANLPALEACIAALRAEGAERYICCGDVIGYYAHTNPVVETLRKLPLLAIAGNHDRNLGEAEPFPNPFAAAGVDFAKRSLTARNRQWLLSLPPERIEEIDGLKVGIFHGSPFDPDAYVFEPEVDASFVSRRGLDVCIMGHTHRPYVRRYAEGLVLNAGSVGQPRDGDPRSACLLLETGGARPEARILRVDYDRDRVYTDTLQAGLPHENAKRLFKGV